jgi:hypothetical protein
MGGQNQVLIGAIRKLALAGEQAGFNVPEMIELLNTGVSVDTLLDLICCRLAPSPARLVSVHMKLEVGA